MTYSNLSVRRFVNHTKMWSRICFAASVIVFKVAIWSFWATTLWFTWCHVTTRDIFHGNLVIVKRIIQYFFAISDNLSKFFVLKHAKIAIWFSGLPETSQIRFWTKFDLVSVAIKAFISLLKAFLSSYLWCRSQFFSWQCPKIIYSQHFLT